MKTTFGFLLSCLVACGSCTDLGAKQHTPTALASDNVTDASFVPGGRVGQHGMVVFGDLMTGYFASHIPMFHTPHDVQVVFAIELEASGVHQLDIPPTGGTVNPKTALSLDDMIRGSLFHFEATLYDGNFEAGAEQVGEGSVRIVSVAGKPRVIDSTIERAATPNYLVVGRKYLIHVITHPNDYDHVVELDSWLSQEKNNTIINFDDRKEGLEARLREGESFELDGETFTVVQEISTLVGPNFTP